MIVATKLNSHIPGKGKDDNIVDTAVIRAEIRKTIKVACLVFLFIRKSLISIAIAIKIKIEKII
jgi:hypothetical protein